MIKKALVYLLGIFVVGWVIATMTGFVLGFLPHVALVLAVATPIYGYVRMRMQWQHNNLGVKRFAKAVAQQFKFSKKSWTFYLVLGVVIGFVFDELVWKMTETIMFLIFGVTASWVAWEATRFVVKKLANIEIVSYKEAMRAGWK